MIELLLLSNSRTSAGFLVDYLPLIRALAGPGDACFIPFAAVTRAWADYTAMVAAALAPAGIQVGAVSTAAELDQARLVIVGGGNTFQLLAECRSRGLLAPLAARVRAGAKYLGWSAGSNLACPTIKTTNDMPIVDPGGLDALGLVPFQINPHYTSASIPGHRGETRDERLTEFARANPHLPVLGLPEGDWLKVRGSSIELGGPHPAMWFHGEAPPAARAPGSRLP